MTTEQRTVPPGGTNKTNSCATGPHSFRPVTRISTINEGILDFEKRLDLEIISSIAELSYNDCTTSFVVVNRSDSIKGCMIAKSTDKYKTISDNSNSRITAVSDDKVFHDIIKSKLIHLNSEHRVAVKNLIMNFRDIFSISNDIIGKANITKFDIDTSRVDPVAVPLQRIPVHHRDIVDTLLNRYCKLV